MDFGEVGEIVHSSGPPLTTLANSRSSRKGEEQIRVRADEGEIDKQKMEEDRRVGDNPYKGTSNL